MEYVGLMWAAEIVIILASGMFTDDLNGDFFRGFFEKICIGNTILTGVLLFFFTSIVIAKKIGFVQ